MKLFIFLAAAAVLLLVDNCDAWFSRRGSLRDSRVRSLSNSRCPKPRFGGCDTTNSCSGGQCLQIPECTTTSTYCAVSLHFCHATFCRRICFVTGYGSKQVAVIGINNRRQRFICATLHYYLIMCFRVSYYIPNDSLYFSLSNHIDDTIIEF